MKKVKAVLWIILVALFALVVYQNQDFFLSRQSLGINLYFAAYRTIELPNAVLFVGFFLLGWLIAYVFGLGERFRLGRRIKSLRQTIIDQQADSHAPTTNTGSLKAEAYPTQSQSEPAVDSSAFPQD